MALITTAHTDGACAQNTDKIGGWAAIINHGEQRLTGWEYDTTNNRMELAAIRAAIIAAPQERALNIRSDSEWAINAITGEYNVKANVEEVQEIRDLIASRQKAVTFNWIARNSEPDHARADHLAKRMVEDARREKAARDAESTPKGVDTGGTEE